MIALLALGMAGAAFALFGVAGVALYLRIDYRASRDAGEVIEAARQALAPLPFPRRPQ